MIRFIIQFLFYSIMLFNLRVLCSMNADNVKIIAEYAKKTPKCSEDNPISPQDLEMFRNAQMPDIEIAKCFMACIYKITGMIDDQGMFSVEGVNNIARVFMSEDPEWQKKAEHYVEACLSVNDVEVSDGAKGCERTALIFQCRLEKAPEFFYIR